MTVRPHGALSVIRADEIAECWEGVDRETYDLLWSLVPETTPWRETPPEPDVDAVVEHWGRLTEAQQLELNRLAALNEVRY